MIHVLLIGAGTMGKVHANAYQEMENVKIVGIVDAQRNAAELIAAPMGLPVYPTLEEAMDSESSIDVVDVCVPTSLHKEFVIKAANLGKHVICEKPLSRSLDDAKEMIDCCNEKNVMLFVAHVVRFFPEYQKAREVLENGNIGKPGVVRTFRGGAFPLSVNDWYADFQNSGGLVLDMIIHDFDYLRWCFGEVKRVYAKSLLGRGLARLDHAVVTLRFENGVIAHVEGSWAHEGFKTSFEIAGSKGIIEFDSLAEQPLISVKRNVKERAGEAQVPESPLKNTPYFRQLNHFIHCIETSEEPIVSSYDAYKAMEIALAALKSIETGKVITLNTAQKQEMRGSIQ
ncbi:Gfo/Idh/MocA family protein [Metabacillus arenae]|uniref:Gfo/Idh/MocA family oxidoreductase n=1 Tax=Metabacillus arenae TaxID=2771434 RepID=A0A926N8N4_9BACI|nr:Gfo/Idh/MocA family oxidoreductase [Metabacillus arenae]MBD1379507.1 Gfo/Idh/MocA family oxidoreductase [Metabacillus arenae]